HDNTIHLLPALPASWINGSIQGLRARGDSTVAMSWWQHQLTSAVITAGHTGHNTLRSALFTDDFILANSATREPVSLTGKGPTRNFAVKAGESYLLSKIKK